MNTTSSEQWTAANQGYLTALLGRVQACIDTDAAGQADKSGETPAPDPRASWDEGLAGAPSIEHIARVFGLSSFERDVLLLVAGAELDTRMALTCGRARGLGVPAAPTFSLALARLPDAHWSALHPDAPLRGARLIRLERGDLLTTSPLTIEERVLHFLAGIDQIDARLAQHLAPVALDESLGASQRALAQTITGRLHLGPGTTRTLVYLHGRSAPAMMGVAAQAAVQAGLALYRVRAADLPQDAVARGEFAALWRREAALSQAGLLVDAIYGQWGFAAKESRGLGMSALFAGASGTGKTMAAEVLANELALDLYRIDLSAVVSKYIGETEKNLGRLFDAAEESGAILLFDEGDALFGRRSEVKDSHDRYANIEVSYLLQRMETYRGLAILTTNVKQNIDEGFLRRLRFVVNFPFPGMTERGEIWRRVFPAATPIDALDPARLARLTVAGGNIRNIALGTAFMAADRGEAVNMNHVLEATRAEYAKLGRSLGGAETGDEP